MYIPAGSTGYWSAITGGIQAIATAQELLNVTFSSAVTYLKGADTTGDDLDIYANRTDSYPHICLKGNGNIDHYAAANCDHSFYGGSAQIGGFDLNSGYPSLWIKETTTDPNNVAGRGYLFTKSDNKLYFIDGDGTKHEVAFV